MPSYIGLILYSRHQVFYFLERQEIKLSLVWKRLHGLWEPIALEVECKSCDSF